MLRTRRSGRRLSVTAVGQPSSSNFLLLWTFHRHGALVSEGTPPQPGTLLDGALTWYNRLLATFPTKLADGQTGRGQWGQR